MKKYMMAVILCTLIIAAFTGCKEENTDISLESSLSESSFTTSATASVSSTEVTSVKETAETSSKVELSATEITQSTAVPTIKETQVPTVSTAPQTRPVIIEQTTVPQTKPVVTSAPHTEKPAVTTAAPKSETSAPKPQKVLNEAFKQELTVYIQNYCKEVGLVYRDDGNTPNNSSWDIPARTRNCKTNDEILEYVKGRARIILVNYGEETVINLYFEDDWEADGEWRIYVLF